MPTERAKPALAAVPAANEIADSSDVCPICFGAGMEIVAGKGARVCSCRRNSTHSTTLVRTKLPKRYANCHLNNFDPVDSSQKTAQQYASWFAMNYPAVERGILFTGPVGIGKTHLAVSILKGLAERGFPCLFYEFGALLKEIQDSYNPHTKTSELGVLAPVLNTEVLVLDELGASKPTDWVRDTMAHIINTRYNDKKATIFTTNYPDERRKESEETLEDRIGVRLRSRLFEMCKTVEMTGDDYRRKPVKPAGQRQHS